MAHHDHHTPSEQSDDVDTTQIVITIATIKFIISLTTVQFIII